MALQRYKLVVEYDGTPFSGFQYQEGRPTVQGALENALTALNKGKRPTLHVAGRTDAGVHATHQVCHVDLETHYEPFALQGGINHYLRATLSPQSVAVVDIKRVDANFHARFSALERAYIYKIINRRAPLALDHLRAWQVPVALDAAAMQEGANLLIGHHDFTTFRATECQSSSPIKTLDALSVRRLGDYIEISARSRSFLHHQVRNMVGSLKLVGEGKWKPQDVKLALEAKDRRAGGPTAPAHGLYLVGVRYEARAQ